MNDTIINKVSDDYYKKFFGKTDESAYLLFYRKILKNEDMKSYQINVNAFDNFYKEITEKNSVIQTARYNYEAMKSCIRVKIVFFDTLTSVELVNELEPERILDENIPQELCTEVILNKNDIYGFIEDIENKLDIKLSDFDCYEVIVKSNRLVYYKRKLNFEYLIGLDPQMIDIVYGSTFVLVHKDASLNLPYFYNFVSENVD